MKEAKNNDVTVSKYRSRSVQKILPGPSVAILRDENVKFYTGFL